MAEVEPLPPQQQSQRNHSPPRIAARTKPREQREAQTAKKCGVQKSWMKKHKEKKRENSIERGTPNANRFNDGGISRY